MSSKDQIAQPPTDSVENILYDILGGYHLVLNGEVAHEPFYGTTNPESDLRPGKRCDTDSKANFVNRAKWMFDKHIGTTVEEAVAEALSTSTSSVSEEDAKPSGTLEENIELILFDLVQAVVTNSKGELKYPNPVAKAKAALLSLYQKELEKVEARQIHVSISKDFPGYANGLHIRLNRQDGSYDRAIAIDDYKEPSKQIQMFKGLVQMLGELTGARGMIDLGDSGVNTDTKPDLTGEQP